MTQLTEIATRHQAHVERLKSNEVKSFDSFLKAMQRDTLRLLHDDGEITDYTRKRLTQKLSLINQVLKQVISDFKPEFDKIVLEFAQYESGFEKKSLESVVETSFIQPSSTQVRTAVFNNPLQISGVDGGSLIDDFYKNQSAKNIMRTVNILNMGYAQGKTNAQIGKDLKELGFAPFDRNMKNVIRTSMQHASNQSRQATWKANRDVVGGVKWSSTLDSSTSSICRGLDGKVFPTDSGPRPPAHYGCRSTTVSVLKKEYQFLSEGRQRSSRDPITGKVGSVSAKQTYYGWLKNQPAQVQDSIIGSSRGKLLRNGGLTTERFTELQLHKNFKPMTLKDMEKLEPTAFIKANIDT